MNLVSANEPWLDRVPSDWPPSRIRNVAQLSPGYSDGVPGLDEPCTVVPMELVSEFGAIDTSSQQRAEDINGGLTLFENGDVIFAKITPCMENGKGAHVSALPTRYAFGSTEFHVLRPNHGVDGKFLYYYTFNPVYRAYAAENMSGAAGQKRVSSRFLKDTRLVLPDISEQKRIAAYLDASCAAIDAAVAAKRRQIEVLKTLLASLITQSVVHGLNQNTVCGNLMWAWLQGVPKHWRYGHLKRFTKRIQTGVTPPTANPEYYEAGAIPWFAPGSYDGDLELHSPRKLINEVALHDGALRMFPSGTIFFIGIGATIGKVGMISAPASCNQQIIGIVANHDFLPKYLAYQMKIYENIIPGIATATTLPIFDQVKTGYLPVVVPPKQEQQTICEYLDAKTADSNLTVVTIESQIKTLTAYRKSLIHECVTGQRRVSDEDVKRAEAQWPSARNLRN